MTQLTPPASDAIYTDERVVTRSKRDETVRAGQHYDDTEFASTKTLASLTNLDLEPGYVSLSRIVYDNYCRNTTAANLRRLRSNWQPQAVGAIYVSKRPNGYFAVVDGRHRCTVAQEMGMEIMPAIIMNNLSYEQEAALYNLFNRVSPHTALDRLQGRVEAKEPKALHMTELIAKVGQVWDFGHTGGAGRIHPVATLEHAYDSWGPEVLSEGLHLLHDAWGDNRDAYRDDTIGGVVQFLARYGGYSFSVRDQSGRPVKYDRSRMRQLMQERGLRIFRSEAIQISQLEHLRRSHSFGRAMRSIYNLHLRSGQLPTWPDRLYSEAGHEAQAAKARKMITHASPEERARRARKSWATRRTEKVAALSS